MSFSKKRKIKFLFVARGPGETSQARALAKYIVKKGEKVLFCLLQKKNLYFLSGDKEIKTFLTENPKKLKKIIEKENPDALLIFNSKTWGGINSFLEKPPFKKPPLVIGFDSNWLFNNKKYPAYQFIKWCDKYLVLFPKKIFEMGLKEKRGNFIISKKILKKIIPVGFIPSYKKPSQNRIAKIRKEYGVQKNEKLIFSYFSGFGAGHRVFAFNNLIDAVERLIKKGEKIKVLYVGATDNLDQDKVKKEWLILKKKLSSNEYFFALSASDIVFQHQGMVTLCQAISVQVPVFCNVHLLKGCPILKLHFWEVDPFKRIKVCEMFSKTTPIKKISRKIEEFLYNPVSKGKMQKKQKLIFEDGEKKSYEIIKKLMKENKEKL